MQPAALPHLQGTVRVCPRVTWDADDWSVPEAGVPHGRRVPAVRQPLRALGKHGLCFCPCGCSHWSILERGGAMIWVRSEPVSSSTLSIQGPVMLTGPWGAPSTTWWAAAPS